MKLSSAAITVAAISLLSTAHAAPLAFKNGEITGRLHHRRGSDLSDVSDISSADEALEGLNIGFEPASNLIFPRILNFLKRQVSSAASLTSSSDTTTAGSSYSTGTHNSGTSDTDALTSLMSPDLESYGFASEGGLDTHLAPVRQIKE